MKYSGNRESLLSAETPESSESISPASADYLKKQDKELSALYEWLLTSRPIVKKLGDSQQLGNLHERRNAQNQLWQSFQENVWKKLLLIQPANFDGTPQEQAEQARLLENWEKELLLSGNGSKGEPETPGIKNLANTLFQELEQHWLAEDLPQDLEKFPFRVSIWMERIQKARSALQKISKQTKVQNI
ncbi:MAG: hypothetical protein M1400_02835 [Patescibacteria group bacterium]|nr:hypothetical protein [Patescibacteria group bacterium]